tara:strand:- start:1801 stop:2049 length:249 start_codon:yes stop_codon:yes gene_type:complete
MIRELLEEIKKVRDDLVHTNNPHFQSLQNIILKWETKLLEEEPEFKLKKFKEREEKERQALEEYARKAREDDPGTTDKTSDR